MSVTALLSIFFCILIGLFSMTVMNSVFRRLPKKELDQKFNSVGRLFFYKNIQKYFFSNHERESLFFAISFTQNLLRFLYATFAIFALFYFQYVGISVGVDHTHPSLVLNLPEGLFIFFLFFSLFFVIGDYFPRLCGIHYPDLSIQLFSFPASLFLTAAFPLTYLFLKASHFYAYVPYLDHLLEPDAQAKQEIVDLIMNSNFKTTFDAYDKKLLASIMVFRDRIAREIMVPRVSIFSLEDTMTIEEAALSMLQEGYSRVPVYRESLDDIIGVLMYKDVVSQYIEYTAKGNDRKILQKPIAQLIKKVLHTPETKKISHLLQEFRKHQVHLAIVVDEYGGTEGIVTIEDILEEIVGDIEDEYDQEVALYVTLPEGGWIVNGQMSIVDIEEQLGILIPQEGDYDTLGGFIFHQAGMIPSKGFIIKLADFQIEVVRSSPRKIEKVRVVPIK